MEVHLHSNGQQDALGSRRCFGAQAIWELTNTVREFLTAKMCFIIYQSLSYKYASRAMHPVQGYGVRKIEKECESEYPGKHAIRLPAGNREMDCREND